MMKPNLIVNVVLVFCFFILGYFVSSGLKQFKVGDRTVAVKGVTERPVKADVGSWVISWQNKADNYNNVLHVYESNKASVEKFLIKYGFESQEYHWNIPRVDLYTSYDKPNLNSFTLSGGVQIISKDVDKLMKVSRNVGELLKENVLLQSWSEPKYSFSDLTSIKPEMISLATQDAKSAAEQFAKDSNSKLGKIRSASQGYFSFLSPIDGLSESNQIDKIARVVVTVEYQLKN